MQPLFSIFLSTLGSFTCTPLTNVTITSATIKKVAGVSSAEACCDLCGETASCMAYVVNGSDCLLKNGTGIAFQAGGVAGLLSASPPPPPDTCDKLQPGNCFLGSCAKGQCVTQGGVCICSSKVPCLSAFLPESCAIFDNCGPGNICAPYSRPPRPPPGTPYCECVPGARPGDE
jgi:hypothetical protein